MTYIFLRRLPKFEYLAPKSLAEACSFLSEHKGQARALAGGTDLLPAMKRRQEVPQYLVGLRNIPGLGSIGDEGAQGLKMGAMATIHDLETSPAIRENYPILNQAAHVFGSTQVRNLATVGGNLCSAAPSADSVPSLLALGATLKLVGPKGERSVPADKFFTAPFQTVLGDDELLAEIAIPAMAPGSAGVYLKLTMRAAMDHALVGVAAVLTLDDGTCKDIKIALGACNPVPLRAIKAEEALRGKALNEKVIEQAAQLASGEAQPRTDPEYKKEMIQVLTRRAVTQAWHKARGL